MRSEPTRLGGISLAFAGSHLGGMNIFHMNKRKWASSARWDRVFFNAHLYVLFWNYFPIRFQHGCEECHHEHS